jgi:hypothetical protein
MPTPESNDLIASAAPGLASASEAPSAPIRAIKSSAKRCKAGSVKKLSRDRALALDCVESSHEAGR